MRTIYLLRVLYKLEMNNIFQCKVEKKFINQIISMFLLTKM
jgi:hypothetical protein